MSKKEFIDFLLENNFIRQNSEKLFMGYINDYLITIDFFGIFIEVVDIKIKKFNYKTKDVDIINLDNKSFDFTKNYINKLIRKQKISKIFK